MQFRDHPGVQGKRDAYPFDPRLLKIEPSYNVRDLDAPDEREDLKELKESIRANGVRVPLEVRLVEDEVFIIAGHRRHKAVMELIGEGEPIKAVPVIPEPKNTSAEDRIINLVISNSGKPLKPLEVAEVVRRLVAFGWEKQQIASRLGKSTSSISGYLDMIAMPEPVKEQVRENVISATEAARVVKNLAPGTDPVKAAELIKANQEENKKIVGDKKNRSTKVTRKTLERGKAKETPKSDPAKPEPEKAEAQAQPPIMAPNAEVEPAPIFTPLSDETPPRPEPMFRDADERPHEPHPQLQTAAAREFPAAALQAPTSSRDFDREMFAIVARLATIAEENCIAERTDDELISVPAEVLKAADRAYRSRISDDTAEAA